LVLLLVLAIGLATGWWLFERTAGTEADAATDLALETRALEAVLAREGQKLLQAGDPEGAITVAALLEGLAPRSAAAKQLRSGAEELTQTAGVVPDAPRIVRRPVEDPARVAREVLGDSPQAAEVSAALTRQAEARDRLQLAPPSATSLQIGLRSEVPRGSVLVYAGDRQIYKREFSFVERRGFFRKKAVAGELAASVGLEPGEYELLVYVVRRNEPAQLTRLATVVGAGDSLQLEIVVPTNGAPEVRLL
jgi:hypothetical protein